MTGGEPARFPGPTAGRVMPMDPEEGGLLEFELRNAAGSRKGPRELERGLRNGERRWQAVEREEREDVLAVAFSAKG